MVEGDGAALLILPHEVLVDGAAAAVRDTGDSIQLLRARGLRFMVLGLVLRVRESI